MSAIDAAKNAIETMRAARNDDTWPNAGNLVDDLIDASAELVEHCEKIDKQRVEAISGLDDVAITVKHALHEAQR